MSEFKQGDRIVYWIGSAKFGEPTGHGHVTSKGIVTFDLTPCYRVKKDTGGAVFIPIMLIEAEPEMVANMREAADRGEFTDEERERLESDPLLAALYNSCIVLGDELTRYRVLYGVLPPAPYDAGELERSGIYNPAVYVPDDAEVGGCDQKREEREADEDRRADSEDDPSSDF